MNSLRKIERDHAAADLAAVERMLANLTDEDVLTRHSLEERREELRQELQNFQADREEPAASAAVFFSGRPVIGTMGIDSEFCGRAVATFQDLVAKQYAQDAGGIGLRGVIPNKAATRLHVTNVVRGSFGFLFEEINAQPRLLDDTTLKTAVNNAVRLMAALGADEDEPFQEAVANVDQRVLGAARDFFTLMLQDGAAVRIVVGDNDRSFDSLTIERAADRTRTTTVSDAEERITGALIGVLPEGHMFEFRSIDGDIIRGKVDTSISAQDVASLYRNWADKASIAIVNVRRVMKADRPLRQSFTLRGIEAMPRA